ncbi:MAG: cobalt ABC transporter permease, partial [Planctomycetes bacterium]|nr:cobalt ABC transporter permease [Planctomycetota bacterium]
GGYAVYVVIRRWLGGGARGTVAGAVVAAWLTVMATAALFCLEFQLSWWRSQETEFRNLFTLMVSFHSLIGLGEAIITGCVLGFVVKQRPDLLYDPEASEAPAGPSNRRLGSVVAAGLVLALAIAAFLAPLASAHPDGLEAAAVRTGIDRLEATRPLVLEDYAIPFLQGRWQALSVAVAGIGGTVAVFVTAVVLGRIAKRREPGS